MTASDNLLYISDAWFAALLEQAWDKPVLVDFYADRCGPCKMLGPIISEIADEYADKAIITKCDVDSNPWLAWDNDISSIPAVKIFHKWVVVWEQVGLSPKEVYTAVLDTYCA